MDGHMTSTDYKPDTLAMLVKRLLVSATSEHLHPYMDNLSPEEQTALSQLLRGENLENAALDASSIARTKLLQSITTLLTADSLRGERAERARRRLTLTGLVRPDQCRISWVGETALMTAELGVRPNHVEEILRKPDAFQRFSRTTLRSEASVDVSPEAFETDESDSAFYFAAKWSRPAGRVPFVTVVQTVHLADELIIETAWRLYEPFLPYSPGARMVDLLTAFTNRYGIAFELPHRSPTKLVIYDVVNDEPIGPGFNGHALQDGSVTPYVAHWIKLLDAPARFGRSVNVRSSPLGVIEVALTYFIDLAHYSADLRRFSR